MPFLSKRKEKLRFKPWITRVILKSIQQRDKIYKQIFKAKTSKTKQLKFILYKMYRNIIVDLLKKSKEFQYRKYFEDNIAKQFRTKSTKSSILNQKPRHGNRTVFS